MSSYPYSLFSPTDFTAWGFLPQISQIYTELLAECVLPQISQIFTDAANFKGVHLSPLGFAACQSKKCTNQARSAPPEISRFCEFCVFCGRHFAVAEARIPPLLSSAPNKSVSICEICGRTSPARVKSVGGLLFAWLVHLRQVHPLKTASVKIREICGRLFSARSFCEFCGFRGRFYSARSEIRGKPFHAKILTRNSKGR